MRTLLSLSTISAGHAQFDFDKEVAGFFDFGKIPPEFSAAPQPSLLNFSPAPAPAPAVSTTTTSTTPTPAATVFTAFSTSAPNIINQNDMVGELSEKIDDDFEGNDYQQQLPGFGEIQHNLLDKYDLNITQDDQGVKKRSYGHGGGGGGGGYGGRGSLFHLIIMLTSSIPCRKPQQWRL